MDWFEDEFVPYNLAYRMEKIGYNGPYLGQYFSFSGDVVKVEVNYVNDLDNDAPTFRQAFKWFASSENFSWPIESWIQPHLSNLPRMHEAFYWRRGETVSVGVFKTHEEAEVKLLERMIQIVEDNQ